MSTLNPALGSLIGLIIAGGLIIKCVSSEAQEDRDFIAASNRVCVNLGPEWGVGVRPDVDEPSVDCCTRQVSFLRNKGLWEGAVPCRFIDIATFCREEGPKIFVFLFIDGRLTQIPLSKKLAVNEVIEML